MSGLGDAALILSRPEELNRVLIVLDDLETTNGVAMEVVVEAASQLCFGALLPDISSTIAFAAEIGFLTRQGTRITLSGLGRAFLAYNPDYTYDLTNAQKRFLAHRCIFEAPYQRDTQAILAHFRPDLGRKAFVCDLRKLRLSPEEISCVSFLRATGVIDLEEDLAQIVGEYSPSASMLSQPRRMSPEELQQILERKSIRGSEAETLVLTWERRRLRSLGCSAESDAVQHTSLVDVCAGYDISSFNDRAGEFLFDRFIEVKSTVAADPQFILTRNELSVAERLGKKYWLYVVCNFGIPKTEPVIWALQNPHQYLKEDFDLECLDFKGTLRKRPKRMQRVT